MRTALILLFAVSVSACQFDSDASPDVESSSRAPSDVVSTVSAPDTISTIGDDRVPSDEEAEANRYRGRGRDLTGADTTGTADAQRGNTETLADLDSTRDWSTRLQLPLGGDVEGPSVAKLQVLLDRAGFSPGQIDGRWGDNTELALVWFQRSADLEATTVANQATINALSNRAGQPQELIIKHVLTGDDVAGPFAEIPDDVYDKADLDGLGFESLSEKLGEQFHAAPSFLAQLNSDIVLDSLAAGDTLRVPNVLDAPDLEGDVSRLVISGEAGYIHALADNGDVLFHAPVTVGSSYDPSPDGTFEVESVTRDPWWHYQPSILEGVPDSEPEAHLPPGPNNAVGVVWMALSKEHYGIHGTRAPGTIGYASSAGCVRLTNWDVLRLAGMVSGGTPVRFRDMTSRSAS